MSKYTIDEIGAIGAIALGMVAIVALTGYGITKAVYQANAQAECLAQGYPEARTDWKFNSYCVSYDFRTTVRK